MNRLSPRMDGVSESATLKLNALVTELKAQGKDIVNLTAGEPDFGASDVAKAAIVKALEANKSKYTPVAGVATLRDLIAARTSKQQPGVPAWKSEHVVVTNGGKQAIYNAFQALLAPGDTVLIPSPYWLSYPEMAKLAQAKSVFLPTARSGGFVLDAAILEETLKREKTARILVLNSPSNPTGGMYSREQLQAIGRVLQKFPEVLVLSDEIYDELVFDGKKFVSFLDACPELAERTITVNGLSKSGAMTGWRLGWSVAAKWMTQAFSTLQGQATSGVNALAQEAAIAVLKSERQEIIAQRAAYERRRNLALEILRQAGKIELGIPAGAFYIFAGIGAYLKSGEDSVGFCERMLTEASVALIPGTPFGDPKSVRLSFATDDRVLEEGCRRLVSALK